MTDEFFVRDLPNELLRMILEAAPTLVVRQAARVCKRWRTLLLTVDTSLVLVAEAGKNRLVLLDGRGRVVQAIAIKPTRKRWTRNLWPTCMAFGPAGELVVSQYRVSGYVELLRPSLV